MSSTVNANLTTDITAWHAMSVDAAAKRLTTDTGKGLEAAAAAKRLQEYGPNRLPEGKKRGPFMRFLSQFNNILVYVLLGAGFTKLMLNLWVDAAIIFGVVILNALLGFIQEGKAEKALESIRNMLSAEARTLRGGETRIIAAEQLRGRHHRKTPTTCSSIPSGDGFMSAVMASSTCSTLMHTSSSNVSRLSRARERHCSYPRSIVFL
jgi:magnesium-transporting ATPase (P-type)